MKKILLFVFAMVMASTVMAQSTITIVPATDNATEKIAQVPPGYAVVYFAKEAADAKNAVATYYVVVRPTEGFDYKKFKLFSGPANAVVEIKNASVTRDEVMIVQSAIGKLSFPTFGTIQLFLKDGTTVELQRLARD